MGEPITLNKLDVARAAAKAYREGRLSAQGPTPACMYRDPSGCPCVIGAAVDNVTAFDWDDYDNTNVIGLHGGGRLTSDDLDKLADLQSAHDDWAQGLNSAEARLVSLLNEILPPEERIEVRTGEHR